MILRFYFDPATGEPHIYNHGIVEDEVEDVIRRPVYSDRRREGQ